MVRMNIKEARSAWENIADDIGVNANDYEIRRSDAYDVAIHHDMLQHGISWCEDGKTADEKETSICGECKYCNYADCDCISDSADEEMDESVIVIG